jgi:hypothetical protein
LLRQTFRYHRSHARGRGSVRRIVFVQKQNMHGDRFFEAAQLGLGGTVRLPLLKLCAV